MKLKVIQVGKKPVVRNGQKLVWALVQKETDDAFADDTNMGWGAFKEGTTVDTVIAEGKKCAEFTRRGPFLLLNEDGTPRMQVDENGEETDKYQYVWRFDRVSNTVDAKSQEDIQAELQAQRDMAAVPVAG